jgi:hypothetical protein
MYVVKATTGSGTPALNPIGGGRDVDIHGVIATSAETGPYFVKFWWGTSQSASPIPSIGTTVPNFTMAITTAAPGFVCSIPIHAIAPVYWAATGNAGDTDDTALAGGDVINILLG